MQLGQLVQYIATGITMGSNYALVGLGFTIIFAVSGIINFAQGEFVMLGGMLTWTLLRQVGLPLPVAVVLAIAISAGVGLLLERLAIRPARRASVVSLIIITVGASIVIRSIAGQVWGKDAVPIPPFSGEDPIPVLGAAILPQSLWVLGTTIAVMIVLHLFFGYTMLGKAFRACALSRRGASLVGIDARAMSALSFSLSAAIGAIGGVVVAPITLTSYDVGVMLGLKGFVAAAMGGFTNQIAAVVGGIGLGVLEALGAGYISSAYKDAIALLVLFLVLVGRSFGLFRWGQDE